MITELNETAPNVSLVRLLAVVPAVRVPVLFAVPATPFGPDA